MKIPVSTNMLHNVLGISEPIIGVSYDAVNSIVLFHTEDSQYSYYDDASSSKLELNYTNA